jgi:hypothetical protein
LNGLRGGGLPQSGDRDLLEQALAASGIPPGERAERLAPEQLLALSRALESRMETRHPQQAEVEEFGR